LKSLKILLIILLSALFLGITVNVRAASYTYSEFLEPIESPDAMILKRVINTNNILDDSGLPIAFGALKDVFVLESEKPELGTRIYLLDSSNNRIVVLDQNYEFVCVYPGMEPGNGLDDNFFLHSPSGLFVTDNAIYVADTDAKRVAIFNHKWGLIKSIKNPDDPTFENAEFKPLKVAVDRNGRIYVISSNIFEGIIDFNPDYTFNRYVGMALAEMPFWKKLFSIFATEEQRSKMGLKLAITYTNLNIDTANFIYAVSSYSTGKPVQKINSKGSNVLKQYGYGKVVGDYQFPANKPSNFVDIALGPSEMYSVLDDAMGRIFTYDFEGNLLYICGGIGSQASLFNSPEAISYFGEDLLIVDSINQNLVVYEPTEFAKQVNMASKAYYENDYEQAAIEWEKVLRLNTNYPLAYDGIGKAQYRQGKYKEAAANFKLAADVKSYSNAYKEYRAQQLQHIMPYVLVVGLSGAIFLLIRSIYRSTKNSNEEGSDE
jgi:tetratricopeptide (TPR) repeat protein